MRIPIKVKKLNPNAVLPQKGFPSDYCFDVVATSIEEVKSGRFKYGIGLAFEISDPKLAEEWELDIELRMKSSVYKHGMLLTNSPGTVDINYRGEVFAVFWHYDTALPKYEIGDQIGQVCVGFSPKIDFMEVEELSSTDRGDGGYGSTTKK